MNSRQRAHVTNAVVSLWKRQTGELEDHMKRLIEQSETDPPIVLYTAAAVLRRKRIPGKPVKAAIASEGYGENRKWYLDITLADKVSWLRVPRPAILAPLERAEQKRRKDRSDICDHLCRIRKAMGKLSAFSAYVSQRWSGAKDTVPRDSEIVRFAADFVESLRPANCSL